MLRGLSARLSLRRLHSAATFAAHGKPASVLSVDSVDAAGAPGAKEVAVRFLAAPLAASDLAAVRGASYALPSGGASLPAVAGSSGVAVVTSVGSDVTSVAKDDWVAPTRSGLGSWRQTAVLPADAVTAVPSDLLPAELMAAGTGVAPLTALRLLNDFAKLREGDWIIHNGADGAVGQAVVAIAASMGVSTLSVLRAGADYRQRHTVLRGCGAGIVVDDDYLQSWRFRRLLADMPAPRLALDCVGGQSAAALARSLADGGVIVTYGDDSDVAMAKQTRDRGVTAQAFSLAAWQDSASAEQRAAAVADAVALLDAGALPQFVRRVPFSSVADAVAAAAAGGDDYRKMVLVMDE
eukprot:PLAT4628.2.p1 GENE.PLAT4628.2~~PLAT4628.2.p1  ORF type:complete len:352 (-),score=175.95 PLAT4628.2:129-1184(-)